jgi:hypothetical protein
LGCRCCLPSVNTTCGDIMIGLSLSSISKHNMWSYYDWVVVVVRQWTQYVFVLWLGCRCCLLSVNTIFNDNPIIIRPHIAFTDGRQRQPNHNTTTYCVSYYDWVVVVFFPDGRTQRQPNHNTTCGGIMIGLSLLPSVSKLNVWSHYDWVVVVVHQ